jgi:DNA end-binding protein Ku
VRYEKVSEKSGEELDADDIVMGYELANGRYVTFEKDELDDLQPASTRTLDVTDFVDRPSTPSSTSARTGWRLTGTAPRRPTACCSR